MTPERPDSDPRPAPRSTRWATLLGTALAVAAAVFVARRLLEHWPRLIELARSPRLLTATAIASVGYGLANLLLSSAWHRLLIWCGGDDPGFRTARSIFARSQLAKYLPGNIFHLAGRQLLGRRSGVGHRPLAASAVMEAWGLVTAALVIAVVGMTVGGTFGLVSESSLKIGRHLLIVLLLLAISVPWTVRFWPALAQRWRRPARSDRAGRLDRFGHPGELTPAIVRYLAFFLVAGGLLAGLTFAAASDISPMHLAGVTTLAAVAWIGGYLTPGAPAGLGVREAILVTTLTPIVGAGESLAVTAAFRAATVTGDLLFGLIVPRGQ